MNLSPFSRRALLRLFGSGTAAAGFAAQAASAAEIVAGSRAPGFVANRAELARQRAETGATWRLGEGGRAGIWIWQPGNLAAKVKADPLQGLYIAHADISPTRGAWVRDWDGLTGRTEWFGAQANTPDFDSQPSLQAALDLCPAVQLGPGSYYIARGIRILRSGSHLFGAGITQTDQGPNDISTRIVCTSAIETILQVGADSKRKPTDLVEGVRIEGLTVDRSVNPFTPDSGILGCIGIAMSWCVNCHAERVFSLNSCRGWFFSGTVQHYVRWCSALREREGSNAANDVFVGFHFDGDAPSGYNGGNASVYLTFCRAFPSTDDGSPSLGYSAGVRLDNGWGDIYIKGFECGAGIKYGIHGIGDGYGSSSFRTENLMITDCVLDPGAQACIALEGGGHYSAVTIANNYFATMVGTAVILHQLAGSISVANNQFIVGRYGGTGLSAVQVNNLRSDGNIYTNFRQPIYLGLVTNFEVSDTINGITGRGDYPAITVSQCARGEISCIVSGVPSSYTKAIDMQGTGNSLIEVKATKLNGAAIAGGAANTLVHNGTQITSTGVFGTNCLVSGIMR